MPYLQIPGTHKLYETPVTPTTQEGSTRLPENSDKADTDDEYPPADTPSLMREISEALSRPEVGIFKADDSDEDHEGQSDNENNENDTNPKNDDSEDSPQALEDEASDTDFTTTVEFTASKSAERENRSTK